MPTTVDLNQRAIGPDLQHRNVFHLPQETREAFSPAVIAIDPGETTGWSLVTVNRVCFDRRYEVHEHIIDHFHGQVDCGRSQGALDIYANIDGDPGLNPDGEAAGVARLMQLIDGHPNAAVLIEDFILDYSRAKKDRSSLSPVRVTARLEQELWQRNRIAHRQTPSLAKVTMSDERLRELGLYQRTGGLEHARDADRHAITFLRRAQLDLELRFRAWPFLFSPPVIKKKTVNRKPKEAGARITFPID